MAPTPTFLHVLRCCIDDMIQDDACGEIIAFVRKDFKLIPEVIDPYHLDLDHVDQFEVILFDGGNTAGDLWKKIFFPQRSLHYFVDETREDPLALHNVGPSLKAEVTELIEKAAKGMIDPKVEAVAWADAYLKNVGLPSYTDQVKAHSWKPIAEAPKDRYILGRDPGLKRPFVMIWNSRDQRFEASNGLGDETPTEYTDLPV